MGLRLRPGVVMQAVGADLVVLDIDAGLYFDINSTGSLLLSAWIDGADDLAAVATVTARYGVSAAQVQADAVALKADLLQHRLLEQIG